MIEPFITSSISKIFCKKPIILNSHLVYTFLNVIVPILQQKLCLKSTSFSVVHVTYITFIACKRGYTIYMCKMLHVLHVTYVTCYMCCILHVLHTTYNMFLVRCYMFYQLPGKFIYIDLMFKFKHSIKDK